MAKFYDALDEKLIAFIQRQPMFFIASAAPQGRINLSPKGLDTFRVLSPKRCAYLDITGSGNETAAHARADGRVTLMFCSFVRNPLILRLYGRATVGGPGGALWEELSEHFRPYPGARQIIVITIEFCADVLRLRRAGDGPQARAPDDERLLAHPRRRWRGRLSRGEELRLDRWIGDRAWRRVRPARVDRSGAAIPICARLQDKGGCSLHTLGAEKLAAILSRLTNVAPQTSNAKAAQQSIGALRPQPSAVAPMAATPNAPASRSSKNCVLMTRPLISSGTEI